MLEIWKFGVKYALIFSLQKYSFYYQHLLNFADDSIILQKIAFFGQNNTFTQSNSVRAVS